MNHHSKSYYPLTGSVWKILGLLPLLFCSWVYAQDNVIMRGALVTEPCIIAPGDESIQLDFGAVVDNYLYIHQRTLGQRFQINLTDCDLTLGTIVKVALSGTENTRLPGLLAISAASKSAGIAIGLETPEGKPLPFNEQGGARGLFTGRNRIPLKAYIQAEPQAIANRSIQFGPFSAVATFSLEYQ
ncbi:fimbrial protein [Erwinia persicina]|uniref:fimbrial protein n=1 Tax=Erwinia persicina TaxID=55211 RepID=UPI00177D25FA|nr:fimbrial protein [Erwinia persicina]MBD8214709.1 type 1 fimbrial protein [Erwinia persicina]